jgi:hypothetical protein
MFKCLLLVAAITSLCACSTLGKEELRPWLNSLSDPPAVNVSGVWSSGGAALAGGWGEGRFIQRGNLVSGTLGLYNVEGVVSGTDLYLGLYTARQVFYTAHLKQSGEDGFIGKAVEKAIIDQKGAENALGYLIALKRVSTNVEDTRWLTREEATAWLTSLRGTTKSNITGIWDSGGRSSGGWGEGRFIQTENRVAGTLGFYNVDGAVSGTDVYLVLLSHGVVYHTAHLKQSGDGSYVGKAVKGAIVDQIGSENATSYQMILKKVSDAFGP